MQMLRGIRLEGGGFARSYRFKPLTGQLEASAAQAATASSRAEAIVSVLAAALAHLGGVSVDRDSVLALPFGDARVLMARLAGHVGFGVRWQTATCESCGAPYDFALSTADLPLPGHAPVRSDWIEVQTKAGSVRVRAPLCSDQLGITASADPVTALLVRCVAGADDVEIDLSGLDDDDFTAIDEAMSALSPSIPFGAAISCPACGQSQAAPICTSDWLDDIGDGPLEDVHIIATAYGWGEAEILSLSRERRKVYINLIEAARGMSAGEA